MKPGRLRKGKRRKIETNGSGDVAGAETSTGRLRFRAFRLPKGRANLLMMLKPDAQTLRVLVQYGVNGIS